jgi:acyl carrier protein
MSLVKQFSQMVYVELIIEFEREFKVTTPDNEVKKIVTVEDVITYLCSVKVQ